MEVYSVCHLSVGAARQSLGEGRPLLRVVLEHMTGEVTTLPECYAAHRTLIRLLPRVDSARNTPHSLVLPVHVVVIIKPYTKCGRKLNQSDNNDREEIPKISSHETMSDKCLRLTLPDMSLEVFSLVEAPAAHGTVERAVGGVRGHVGTVLTPCYGLPTHLHTTQYNGEKRKEGTRVEESKERRKEGKVSLIKNIGKFLCKPRNQTKTGIVIKSAEMNQLLANEGAGGRHSPYTGLVWLSVWRSQRDESWWPRPAPSGGPAPQPVAVPQNIQKSFN